MAMEPRGVRRGAAAVRRRHHALLGDPDPAHPQDHARRSRSGIPEHQLRVVAPGGRRRLRVQAQRLRRGAAVRRAGRSACGRPVRWNEERTENAHGHHPRPRPDPGHRAGRRRRRQAHRACGSACSPTWAPTSSSSRPASRCSARSSTPASTTCPRVLLHVHGVFTTMTPTDAYRGAGPARGDLRHRAGDGRPRRADRHRPGRAPPAQLHPHRAVPVHRLARAGLRLRRLRRRRSTEALELVGYDELRAEQRSSVGRRAHQAPRHRRLVLRRDVRPGAVSGCWPR